MANARESIDQPILSSNCLASYALLQASDVTSR